jgi:ubiquinone/menaquinone biosynthesis C-methylase UbiE
MSEFPSEPWHDYAGDVFLNYDRVRQPNGLVQLLQILSQTDPPMDQQRILDGGFGTGAYAARIGRYVLELCGVEPSEEGLRRALRRLVDVANVHLCKGSVLDLPFPDEYFHGYMVNQVLHHLDRDFAFPNLDTFIGESLRVLVPGGALMVNTCTHEQLEPGSGAYWHYKYLEKYAVRTLQDRYVSINELASRLVLFGYRDIEWSTTSGRIFQERYYEDPSLALTVEFRNGDSVYSFLSETEIESANERIRRAIANGSIHDEIRRAAERRAEIGESVIISARKPQASTRKSRAGSEPRMKIGET